MKDLISWYNRNIRKIWIVIFLVCFVLLFINLVKNLLVEKDSSNQSKIGNSTVNTNINSNNSSSIIVSSKKSVVTGDTSSTANEEIQTIDSFITYCNSEKIEEAYQIISDECKELMYPTIKKFKQYYYDNVFVDGKRIVEIANWLRKTYKVDFYEDALSTGNYSKSNTIQDYITVVKNDDGDYKLNINGYIHRTELNKEKSSNDINIKVLYTDTYFEYETYTFEVTNNSDKTIALGDVNNYNFTYLEGENGIEYDSYATELAQEEVVLSRGQTKTITIKYFSRYSSTKNIERVIFPKIILDYNQYKLNIDRNYGDYTNIKISV